MAGSVNKATIIGHLGKDPDIRRTQAGKPIAAFSVATSESWRDKDSGERKEKTQWHNVVIFNENLAHIAEQCLKKGTLVYIEGAIETRKYEKDGAERYITEIVLKGFNGTLTMLGGKSSGGGDSRDQDGGGSQTTGGTSPQGRPRTSHQDLDDEVPF